MPTPQEIVSAIKKRRGRWYRSTGNRPSAWCMLIEHLVVDNLPRAHFWQSSIPKEERDYKGHYVGVIGTRKKQGVIVQFSGANSNDAEIVLGDVKDIHDEEEVTKVLELKTGRKGWKKRY